ncbi:hypothetical protein [Endozoicomonas sp. ONNA1]|uniref:hypothetical protein n=1 Tax=Endozoicomonas sp. ONNA1 TaxID=2828740 RepID=UPI002148E240|nr:hypothetical protein [Endozoicomonas sp. ONNA1]
MNLKTYLFNLKESEIIKSLRELVSYLFDQADSDTPNGDLFQEELERTSDAVGLPYSPVGMAKIADEQLHQQE